METIMANIILQIIESISYEQEMIILFLHFKFILVISIRFGLIIFQAERE